METCMAQNISYLFKTHQGRGGGKLGSALHTPNVCLCHYFQQRHTAKISNYVVRVTGILATILSGAVFQYISYKCNAKCTTTAYKHTHSSNMKGGGKKYIYIYIWDAPKYSPLLRSLVHRQGAGLLCANSQCSSDLVYAWNINSRAQRAITFRLKSTFIFLTVFLITINENIMSF